jgi:hypothetical protein
MYWQFDKEKPCMGSVPMEPESRNDCADEDQKQFTQPDGTKYFPLSESKTWQHTCDDRPNKQE